MEWKWDCKCLFVRYTVTSKSVRRILFGTRLYRRRALAIFFASSSFLVPCHACSPVARREHNARMTHA